MRLSPHPARLLHRYGLASGIGSFPSGVTSSSRLEKQAPWLHLHYQASPLLRACPSLRLASVRARLWGLHSRVSLGIEAAGSHVPHTRLREAHAVCMPATARTISRLPPSFSPRPTSRAWFRWRLVLFDTSSTVHLRSSSPRAPDESRSPFPTTLTTPVIGPAPLLAVWILTLQSESEGPTLIACAARLHQFNRAVTSRSPLRAVVAQQNRGLSPCRHRGP